MRRTPSTPGYARRSHTVLVVDDEVYLRNVMAEVLVMNGYAVLAAEGPRAALLIGGIHRGSIDLFLTDVVMPEMSGFELADRLQAARPGLQVLYMSGYLDRDAIRYRIQEAGAIDEAVHAGGARAPGARGVRWARAGRCLDTRTCLSPLRGRAGAGGANGRH